MSQKYIICLVNSFRFGISFTVKYGYIVNTFCDCFRGNVMMTHLLQFHTVKRLPFKIKLVRSY